MQYSPKKMKENLEDHSFGFKKKFGQNFIIDENTIDNIVKNALVDEDTMVIEIGPGAGSLTYKLASMSKQVLCYEIDTTLKDVLAENLKDFNNVDIIFDDFLKRNVLDDLKKYDYKKLYVVANLPYYITTPIIVKLIEDKINVDRIVVMVQKEVGDRFKANIGTKDYNSLSVFLNYYFDVRKVMDVSRNVFMPMPNVDSIVLALDKKNVDFGVLDENVFFKLVRDSFTQKRKTIKNNLKEYNLQVIEEVLKRNGFDLSVRAENIPINLFVEISNELVKYDRK